MTIDDIRARDPRGMYTWIKDFPRQVEEAIAIGKKFKPPYRARGFENIVLTGLGGSAIGGDLLRSYLADRLKIPFVINRNYVLPAFVGRKTLVIVSSYSGNTEETIAAHKDAIKRKAKVLCVTTDGVTTALARKHRQPCIAIPGGLSPRAALGYSFFPLLVTLSSMGFFRLSPAELKETLSVLRDRCKAWSDPASPDNAPLRLAAATHGMLPIVYSGTERLDAVNIRWRGQISENAKQLAWGNLLPEMNHNELVGWRRLPDLMKKMHVIFLKDTGTHKRVALREDWTRSWISPLAGNITEVPSVGKSLLARTFSLIHFGDWVSLYLAILNEEDPEPVEVINALKNHLAKA